MRYILFALMMLSVAAAGADTASGLPTGKRQHKPLTAISPTQPQASRSAPTSTRASVQAPAAATTTLPAVQAPRAAPKAPGYQLDRTTGTLRFGDGAHGKRPAGGGSNVAAEYRAGGGSSGARGSMISHEATHVQTQRPGAASAGNRAGTVKLTPLTHPAPAVDEGSRDTQ